MRSDWPIARRAFVLATAVGCAVITATGTAARAADIARSDDRTAVIKRIDTSLTAAAGFLIDRQSADGAWRSEVYPPFHDGDALTPLTVASLLTMPRSPKLDSACHLGSAY